MDKFTIGSFWAISIVAEVSVFAYSNAFVRRFGAINLMQIGISGGFLRWVFMSHDFGLGASIVLQSLHGVSFTMVHLGTMHYIRLTVRQGLRNSAQGLYAAFSGGIVMSGMMAVSGLLYGQLLGGTYLVMAVVSLAALSFAVACGGSAPQFWLRRVHKAAVEADAGVAVAGQQQGAIEINDVGQLGHEHGRRHGKRRCQHAADHDLEIRFLGGLGQGKRLGQAAGLVELDVDGVIFADKLCRLSRPWANSSAQIGTSWAMRSRASSSAAGRGCSTSSTPTAAQVSRSSGSSPGSSPHWHRR